MDLEEKYKLLSKCEDELICFVCEEWCKSPARINKCGHYFCFDCIPKQNKCCPKCQEGFFQEDISTVHCYANILDDVQFFKASLETLQQHIIKNGSLENRSNASSNQFETFVDLPFKVSFADPKSFKKNAKGESKLHIACKRRNVEEVKKLIKENIDINSKDYACWTPLHEAVQVGSIDIIKELLSNGALINSPGEFYVTPLHKAVIMENVEVVKLLIENGADKEIIDFNGRKPIDCTKRQDLLDAINYEINEAAIQKPTVFLTNKIVVYCHSVDETYIDKFSLLENLKICKEFDVRKPIITHLIVKRTHKISLKILLCLVGGIIIIPQEWVEDLLKGNIKFLIDPILENCPELSKGIKDGIWNQLLNKPKLFDGINFYVEGPETDINIYNLSISKDFLRLLISTGGGVNLKRAPAPRTIGEVKCFPYHATSKSTIFGCNYIIIFNDNHPPKLQYKMRELQHKSSKWLIDCVINFKLV
ncbi:BRCA1-associated RING domain protein 1-like [Harmonia axyridis]|uniref:BRCA1-associated RING domain protein 1-like n=1 Tax=Harmonia axyridis TaxID=115357 RepID=UPI001E279785|nr:BRCA1-associated RING domain protein 1-like [Harmonia axyridis]